MPAILVADVLSGEPIPLDEGLQIAKQIAEALEAAHEQAIIHRDLKPANIKVRRDGTVKVLDFGLAKAMDVGAAAAGGPAGLSMSPTVLSPVVSGVGMILGTAAYMAPEQARGKSVDKRADIWAFGVVLFEIVTGTRLFPGDEVSEVLASVLARDPDLAAAPRRVRRLLTRCLAKDPKKRLRDIGDAMSLVDDEESPAADRDTIASRVHGDGVASPDGRTLAYYDAGADGAQALVVRTLATGEVRRVPNSATTAPSRDSLFWSPDSKQLVRGSASSADVFDISTGATRRLCDCRYVGGNWNDSRTILLGGFADRPGISRLTLTDSKPVAATAAAASRGELDTWPAFLPEGDRFLFTRVTFDGGSTPVWSPDGSRLAFTASRHGVNLPFQRATDGTGSEVLLFSTPSAQNIGNDLWVARMENRTGATPVPYLVAAGLQQQAQFSPDGRFVAYGSDQSGTFEIYVLPNAAGGKWLVSQRGGVEPRWSRDGRDRFYFSGQTLMAVPISRQPTLSTGTPVALFDAPVQPG
jgi:serine/threonine protein kinase